MGDSAVDNRYFDHGLGCLLVGLFHAGRDFIGFAVAPTDFTFAVTNNDKRGKAESPSTLDNRCTAFDFHNAIDVFTVA
jgi:hypothetical protein